MDTGGEFDAEEDVFSGKKLAEFQTYNGASRWPFFFTRIARNIF
jgi:hypothetical protein